MKPTCFIVFLSLLQVTLPAPASSKPGSVQDIYHKLSFDGSRSNQPQSDGRRAINVSKLQGVKFLVAVNHTWDSCIATVATPLIRPDTHVNRSERIPVGNCDSGPLTYTVRPGKAGNLTLDLTFYSSVIEDASPPTCSVTSASGFLNPTSLGDVRGSMPSVLPGCSTMESREGYHMTYYWFYVYQWFWD